MTKISIPSFFLQCLGVIFLVAYWSYYVQFPGLLSSSGLEPVHRLFPYASPWLYRTFIQSEIMDEDTLVEQLTVSGMFLSSLVATGWIQHGSVLLWLTIAYGFLARVGGTFYSFQWDTLLIETGVVTALCYSPWTFFRFSNQNNAASDSQKSTTSTSSPGVGAWPLRFLLFKLMFMSGLVKIQSECPTWLQLTALEYHFATQCLPGPLAWYAHQMHPFLLRLSVALTLWIEIPLAFLLIGWTVTMRRTGAYWQILLQIMIMLTGNYNFFNLLTMALCLPCLTRDVVYNNDDESAANTFDSLLPKTKPSKWERLGITCFSIGTFFGMFRLYLSHPSLSLWHGLNISLEVSKSFCEQITELLLPWIILIVMLLVVVQGTKGAVAKRNPLLLLHVVTCILVIGIMAVPMCSLTEKLQKGGFIGSREVFQPLWQKHALPYRAANGYGLFRRMTGVGRAFMDTKTAGWAGLGPSVVARPEIILDGLFVTNNNSNVNSTSVEMKWREIKFRWKPGHTSILPRQVAPHQPRLDWQMWFAALGGSQQNPWFIHLVRKLLDGCEDVNQLVGDQKLLSGGRKVKKLRANLYHYDFTRLDTEWNRRIPSTKIVALNNSTTHPILLGILKRPNKVWKRSFARKYFLPIDQDDHTLQEFLSSHGFKTICDRNIDRCKRFPSLWCHIAVGIRLYHLHLFAMAIPLLVLLAVRSPKRALQRVSDVSTSKKNQ